MQIFLRKYFDLEVTDLNIWYHLCKIYNQVVRYKRQFEDFLINEMDWSMPKMVLSLQAYMSK